MIEHSRSDGGHFDINDYYQPLKHKLDSEDNIVINAFELKEAYEKAMSDEMKVNIAILLKEIAQYGRFWLMEGFFPPEEKEKWIEVISPLSTINVLVQEDIRDMILLGTEMKMKEEKQPKMEMKQSVEETKEKDKHGHRRNSKMIKQKSINKTSNKNVNRRKSSMNKKESFDLSEEEMTSPIPKKLDVLRPPLVWNFPIERVIAMKNAALLKEKNETAKVEIRKVSPNICYKDHRVERFMELFNVLYTDAITPTMAVDDKKIDNNTTNLNDTSEKTMNYISAS